MPQRATLLRSCAFLFLLFGFFGRTPEAGAKEILPRLGNEQQVNVRTAGSQTAPAIAAGAAGRYAVSWLGHDGQGRMTVWVRLFDASGAPLTGEIEVARPFAVSSYLAPRIAMAPDGRFVVAWFDLNVYVFRLFDAAGNPRGEPAAAWNVAPANLYGFPGDVAMGRDGRFLLALDIQGSICARLYDADGHPLEEPVQVATDPPAPGFNQFPRALSLADGSYLVAWVRQSAPEPLQRDDRVLAVRRSAQPGPWPAESVLSTATGRALSQLAAVAHSDGGFSLVWSSVPASPSPGQLRARRFDAAGSAPAGEADLPWHSSVHPPALAEGRDGATFVLVDRVGDSPLEGKLFDRSWRVLHFLDLPITDAGRVSPGEPAVARAGDGFVAGWSSDPSPIQILPPPGEDVSERGIYSRRFGAPVCVDGSRVLCLGRWADSRDYGRFEVTVDWTTPDGNQGAGRARALAWESGDFWFFQEENPELVVKVLDGRPVNGRFWVFSGALSNVEYTVRVLDTQTGALRVYHNPQGQLASRADTEAFPGGALEPAPAQADAPAFPDRLQAPAQATGALTACGEEVLCLSPGRELRVGVDFVDPRTGLGGRGQALPLSPVSGAFTFFDPGNLELVVKLLDGGPVNGKIWFFAAGLSDVEYTITVEDPASHATRTYNNSHGQLASRADTRAFNASGLSFQGD